MVVFDWRFAGAVAGLLAPVLLLTVLGVVTIARWSFLRASGWSFARRNDVGWPSILTLGNEGWIVSVTFVLCGLLGGLFALALHRTIPTSAGRTAATLLAFVGAALVVVALPPDLAGATARSWHGQIHDYAYPVIPLASIAAAALLAVAPFQGTRWSLQSQVAVVTLLLLVPSFLLTGVAVIGQLARYFLFGTLMIWFAVLALSLIGAVREGAP